MAESKSESESEDVQEPIRHGRNDMESSREAIPGGIRDGSGEARFRRHRSPIEDARGTRVRQQDQLRVILTPEEDLQG